MEQFYISYVFIGIIVIVSLKAFSDQDFMNKYIYSPYYVKHYREHYRAFSHVFLHADAFHLIFNMLTLFFFGRGVEEVLYYTYGKPIGSVVFVGFFAAASYVATLIPYFRHRDNEWYRSLGASGAVSAVLFAAILFFPTMKVGMIFLPIQIPAWIFGLLYLAFEIWSDRRGRGNIAHDAHIGGALFGILFALIVNIELVKTSFQSLF